MKSDRLHLLVPFLIVALLGAVAAVAVRRHVLYGDALCTTCEPEVDYWHPPAQPVIAP